MVSSDITADRVALTVTDLADEIGFGGVTVPGDARRLGMRTSSPHSHVAIPADLSRRVTLLVLEELADRAARVSRAGPAETLSPDRRTRFATARRAGAHRHTLGTLQCTCSMGCHTPPLRRDEEEA